MLDSWTRFRVRVGFYSACIRSASRGRRRPNRRRPKIRQPSVTWFAFMHIVHGSQQRNWLVSCHPSFSCWRLMWFCSRGKFSLARSYGLKHVCWIRKFPYVKKSLYIHKHAAVEVWLARKLTRCAANSGAVTKHMIMTRQKLTNPSEQFFTALLFLLVS